MEILALIISILKITGIIILVILALILLILLVLLFASIKIQSSAKINNEVQFILDIKYLFGIIRYKYNYKDNQNIIKIFGKKINSTSKKEKNKKTEKDNKQESFNNTKSSIEKYSEPNKKSKKSKVNTKKYLEEESEENKQSFKEKIYKFKNSFNLVKDYYYEYKDKIIKYLKVLIKRLIKAIKIKKMNLNFEYGFYDPSKTGKVCGLISIILPMILNKKTIEINLIPDFNEQKFTGEGYIKIKTNIFKIVFPILVFILKKPIRKIIFRKEK